jgi:hypothetical protein
MTAAKEQWKPMTCDVIKLTMGYIITHSLVKKQKKGQRTMKQKTLRTQKFLPEVDKRNRW